MSKRKHSWKSKEGPVAKKRKVASNKDVLYINDYDSFSDKTYYDGMKEEVLKAIVEEREKSLFKSEKDLQRRVSQLSSNRALGIIKRYNDIKYVSKYQEEVDMMHEMLLNFKSKLLQQQASDTIRIIAEFAS